MSNLLPPIDRPVVVLRAGKAWAPSDRIAAYTQQQHGHLLEKRRKLTEADPAFAAANFLDHPYTSPSGRTEPGYLVTAAALRRMPFRPKARDAIAQYLDALDNGSPELAPVTPPERDPVGDLLQEIFDRGGWVSRRGDRNGLRVPQPMLDDPATFERLRAVLDALMERIQDMPPEPELVDNPVVRVRDHDTYTTSLDVAAYCRKRHADVLRAIENLNCSPAFHQRNFAFVSYPGANGEQRPAYDITRSGAAFLIGGFTGPEAGAFKEAYIDEFDRMEAALKAQALPPPPPETVDWGGLPPAVKQALLGLDAQLQQVSAGKAVIERKLMETQREKQALAEDNAELLPKADALDHYEDRRGMTNLRGVAKLIGVGEQVLKRRCLDKEWLYYNNGELTARADLVKKGWFFHKPVKYYNRRQEECWTLQVMFCMPAINRLMIDFGKRKPRQGELGLDDETFH
jgi:Rha family phage regulatory protein